MKTRSIVFCAVVLLCVTGVWALDEAMPAAKMPMEEMAMPNAGNKICPVSKEAIGGMGEPVQIAHNGKMYNLCCSMCAKDFQNDPDKYSRIADEEVAAQGAVAAPEVPAEGHGY